VIGAFVMQINYAMIFMDRTKVVYFLQGDLFKSLVVVFHVGASKVVVVTKDLHVNRLDTVSLTNRIVKESGLRFERSSIGFANLGQLFPENSKGIGDTLFSLIGRHKDIVKDGKRRRLVNIVITE
jgi:hypothetical protein